jgi:Mrp family chromosome partitioning ATPase
MILSTLADAVILVVESGAAVRGAVARTRRIMANVGSSILGVVLNKVDFNTDGYYGYSSHYYYYYPRGTRKSQSPVAESVDLPPRG